MPSDDPTAIRSIAVTAEDVVAALEATRRTSEPTVLRITPPFSGRMRARLHVAAGTEYRDAPEPLHVPPETLVAGPPPYPDPDETADALHAAGEYSVEAHRRRHGVAVEAWRRAVAGAIVGAATLDLPSGPHRVEVVTLG